MNDTDLVAENAVLTSKIQKLEKENRELRHIRLLDQTEIVNLRRQIELLMEDENGKA